MATVAVIIPFFQRKSGLLARALASICSQSFAAPIDVLVVDDESPTDPAGEIPQQLPRHVSIQVIRTKNGGPGAARNLGLDNVPADTDFVAFLDSDDEWLPDHLGNATSALGDDLDLYFSNHFEPESTIDEFSQRNLIALAEHKPLPRGSQCFEFRGDMRDQIIRANIIETSTVVFRWNKVGSARFRPDFRNAFEDHLFWIDAARLARGIAFSANVECQYGSGVSIWRSGSLGGEYSLPKIIDQLRFVEALAQSELTTTAQTESLRNIRRGVRREFVAEILHRARRGMAMDRHAVLAIVKLDPALLLLGLPIALQIARKRRGGK